MTAQTLQPPREIAQPCPEAQADGFPCEDPSCECGSCAHALEIPMTAVRLETATVTPKDTRDGKDADLR